MDLDRRRLIALAPALSLAGVAGPARAVDPSLAALADPARPDTVLGVAVMARGPDGRVVLEEAHGWGRRTVDGALLSPPFTVATPMRIASITKLVCMTAIMTLVEQGRLSLDADADELAGFRLRHPAHPDIRITPAMLASHTSGLRNGPSYPVRLGRDLRVAFEPGGVQYDDGAWFAPADQPPGVFAYGDVNFPVLAQIAERITGERFDRFVSRTVLEPMGLDVGLNWSGVSQATRDRASGACRIIDGAWRPQVDREVAPAPDVHVTTLPGSPAQTAGDYVNGSNGFVFSPQGGLRASVDDLDRLARMYAGHPGTAQVVARETIDRMCAPLWTFDPAAPNGVTDRGLLQSWGLSVHIPTGRSGDAFFGPDSGDWRGHFGVAYGLQSGLFWNRRDGRTVAWMISGTPREAEGLSGSRSAASPWEEVILDAALAAWVRAA